MRIRLTADDLAMWRARWPLLHPRNRLGRD
jgi:hypothetical protein